MALQNRLTSFTKYSLSYPPNFWLKSTMSGTSAAWGGCDRRTAFDMSMFFTDFPDFPMSDDRLLTFFRSCSHDSHCADDASHQKYSKDEQFKHLNRTTSVQVGSSPIRLNQIRSDQVGWDRIGSAPTASYRNGSDRIRSDRRIHFSVKKKEQTRRRNYSYN